VTSDAPVPLVDYDYPLPPERIAQSPATPRDSARLFALDRLRGNEWHGRFDELPDRLAAGDLVVLNDTQVFKARLWGAKPGGGKVEFLLLESPQPGLWDALCNRRRGIRTGTEIRFKEATARIEELGEGKVRLKFPDGLDVPALLERDGEVPLPPYIHRAPDDPLRQDDSRLYQTVFARHRGAVAAPTAGLHFTEPLLDRLREKGVQIAFVTLHVGPGTFLPVREEDARRHRIHSERFVFPGTAGKAVGEAKERGARVVAVGTTAARVLEQVALRDEGWKGAEGECDLYVLPGHRFRCVDALITNFHLPRSTLLLFVAAFAGRERILAAYREAVRRGYRFYSYGDAMFLH
jgi:S-adenosylmethionine:tRNA ribosyltransferase-isomerase